MGCFPLTTIFERRRKATNGQNPTTGKSFVITLFAQYTMVMIPLQTHFHNTQKRYFTDSSEKIFHYLMKNVIAYTMTQFTKVPSNASWPFKKKKFKLALEQF